jgi:predicted nucleic acid-binding protein
VDTAGWGYYLDRGDPRHAAVDTFVKQAIKARRHLVTTNYILSELVVLLSSRCHLPRQQVITAINAIKAESIVQIIHINLEFDKQAWELLEARLDKEWSLVDASSFIIMRHFGITQALTTDKHFTQAGFVRVPEF